MLGKLLKYVYNPGECGGESCNTSVEFNCVNIIPFISGWKKKCDLGYRSHVPVYPEYTIIRVSTESYYRESLLSIFYKRICATMFR